MVAPHLKQTWEAESFRLPSGGGGRGQENHLEKASKGVTASVFPQAAWGELHGQSRRMKEDTSGAGSESLRGVMVLLA